MLLNLSQNGWQQSDFFWEWAGVDSVRKNLARAGLVGRALMMAAVAAAAAHGKSQCRQAMWQRSSVLAVAALGLLGH